MKTTLKPSGRDESSTCFRHNIWGESMKTILKAATAAVALVGMSGTALADSTSSTVYSAAPIPPSIYIDNNFPFIHFDPGATSAQQFANNIGSRYEQSGFSSQNTETASTTVSNTFTLTGSVTKDCSFYGGGQTGHTINLGTIGVRTGNNDNVSIAFNQRDAITANVNSATAGCNTNNTVTISKQNGSDGLRNFQPGSYDSNQFTDRIPYTINANWTGVAAGTTGAGTNQTLAVAANQGSNNKAGGAWRSTFNMDVNAPVQDNRGLVAGTYTDTITVTLAAAI